MLRNALVVLVLFGMVFEMAGAWLVHPASRWLDFVGWLAAFLAFGFWMVREHQR